MKYWKSKRNRNHTHPDGVDKPAGRLNCKARYKHGRQNSTSKEKGRQQNTYAYLGRIIASSLMTNKYIRFQILGS